MKINLILLGAGDSRRFNGNKLLTKINDKPMYMYSIETILNINFNKIIFVTQYEEIKNQLSNYSIKVIMNQNSKLGISNSIKLGILAGNDCDAYMFLVCDQPFVKSESLEKLIHGFIKSKKGMACLEYNGELGNPTIFAKKYEEELLSLKGDIGGKSIMKKYLDDVKKIKIDDLLELVDVDTQEDLKTIISFIH